MVQIRDLTYSFNGKDLILDHLSLSLKDNTIHSIMGISGAGKTLLLKLISKLSKIQQGSISQLPAKIHYVFQNAPLLPWLSVEDNLIFCSFNKNEIHDALKTFRLYEYKSYFPHELSGGMIQKVNLIRAFLHHPDLILMDEPFVHLDQIQKEELQSFTINLWKKERPTILYVTHDIHEALYISEDISILSAGKISDLFSVRDNPHQGKSLIDIGGDSGFRNLYQNIYHQLKTDLNL